MATAGQRTGQRISEYVLEERVGGGAFGEVWKARHHAWHTTIVAVKLPNDANVIKQLQREGGIVQGLDHPNIVKPLGFDAFADPPYLISEFMEGGSLRAPIERRDLSPQRAVAILRDILAGLTYAHERGIIHRDLKPENILLTQYGRAKIADFGLGQTSAASAMSAVYSMSLDTPQSQAIAGTLDYMAPEQRSGGAIDSRADLYAVGVILFELLTGQKPAGHETPMDLNAAVPANLNEAFRRAYCRVDRRFTSAAEFAAALNGPPPLKIAGGPAGAATESHTTAAQAASAFGVTVGAPPLPSAPKPAIVTAPTHCPRCRRDVAAGDQFCMHCGVQLTNTIRRCARCGSYPDVNDEFCIRCGDAVARTPTNRYA